MGRNLGASHLRKDEVETLNEALKIAALDIAQAAGDQLESDADDDEEYGVNSGEEVGIVGLGAPAAKPRPRAGAAPTTIFVGKDGSYSVKGASERRGSGEADR